MSSQMYEVVAIFSKYFYVVDFCMVACGSNGNGRACMVVVHGKAGSAREKEDRCTFI